MEPHRAYDGQIEFCDGVNWDAKGDGTSGLVYYYQDKWYSVLDEQHTYVTAPLYEEDPHPQYWHVVKDSAAAHMIYQDYTTGKSLTDGAIITNWDADAHTAYKAATDLSAGTITTPNTEAGLYNFFASITIGDMQSNTTYFFQAYKNGVATALVLPIVASGNITSGYNSFSGSIALGPGDVMDLRCIGGSCTLAQANMGLIRYLNTTEFSTGVSANDAPGPIDPDWGQPGGMP